MQKHFLFWVISILLAPVVMPAQVDNVYLSDILERALTSKRKVTYDHVEVLSNNLEGQSLDQYLMDKYQHSELLQLDSGRKFSLQEADAFTTLGFGEIPTKGLARYIAIVQGFIGWFLLSIFSVALINQVLA